MESLPRKPFIEHLEDLRKCLVQSGAAVLVCSAGVYPFSEGVLSWLIRPIQAEAGPVYFFAPAEAFLVRLKTALVAGFLIASPVVVTRVWAFISPGLYPREKRHVLPWVFFSVMLTTAGAVFAFRAVLPVALRFLMGFQTGFLQPMISVSYYVSFALGLVLAFAVAFNLPCVVTAAVSMGLVDKKTLRRFHRHVIVGVFVLSMFLTPPDAVSQVLLGVPLVMLYEASIVLAGFFEKKK